jgi:hypothetical protein
MFIESIKKQNNIMKTIKTIIITIGVAIFLMIIAAILSLLFNISLKKIGEVWTIVIFMSVVLVLLYTRIRDILK